MIGYRGGDTARAMLNFLARRIVQLIPTLFFVSVLIFSLQQLLPGDPALVMAGEERDPAVIEQIRQQYRLDQPMPVQYVYWIKGVLSGDFGESLRNKVPVRELIAQKLPVTIQLASMAIVIAFLIGIPAGIVSAVKKGTALGLRRQFVRAVGHLDAEFLARHHADLPVLDPARLAAGVGLCAADRGLARQPCLDHHAGLRARQRHRRDPDAAHPQRHAAGAGERLRAHRAREGLFERSVILKHAMRNALTPVITLGALELGTLLSGAVLTEQIFSIPGFGKLIVDAVFNRDYAVVQGVVLVTATIYITLNLIADIAYVLVNPRLRG